MAKTKLMFVFGTRPEAIKFAPVIILARRWESDFDTSVVVTAQHRQMLDSVLQFFGIIPDKDLDIMAPGQSLFYLTSRIVTEMEPVISQFDPDIVLVQGDTTTTLAGALCGFYAGKRVAHIEAGLRTGDNLKPFPEEVNRKMTSVIADYHFAPTETAKMNLLEEGYPESTIYVTGNTVIDALLWTVTRVREKACPSKEIQNIIDLYPRFVLITGHRRESFGKSIHSIFTALRRLSRQNPNVGFIYPVHMNPNVQKPATQILSGLPNFFLLSPQPYPTFCWLMDQCELTITDSGGVQEEAPALGKPVLVTRDVSERPEVVKEGMAKLIGDDEKKIVSFAQKLLEDHDFYKSMVKGHSPYGDGRASERILKVLAKS